MLNRFGDIRGQMVNLAGKTRALAEEALTALDAQDDDEDVQEEVGKVRQLAAPDQPPLSPSGDLPSSHSVLQTLVEAITGNAESACFNLEENVEVLVSQLDFVREQAINSPLVSEEMRSVVKTGSLLQLLDSLLDPQGRQDAAGMLLGALEAEQAAHAKSKQRLAGIETGWMAEKGELVEELKNSKSQLDGAEEKLAKLASELEVVRRENFKLQRMLAKVVSDKANLEEERDNNDLVDARVMRSLLVSLGSQIENRPVRNSVLMIAADILHLSPEERAKGCISLEAKKEGLASAFVQFLQEEVGEDVMGGEVNMETSG